MLLRKSTSWGRSQLLKSKWRKQKGFEILSSMEDDRAPQPSRCRHCSRPNVSISSKTLIVTAPQELRSKERRCTNVLAMWMRPTSVTCLHLLKSKCRRVLTCECMWHLRVIGSMRLSKVVALFDVRFCVDKPEKEAERNHKISRSHWHTRTLSQQMHCKFRQIIGEHCSLCCCASRKRAPWLFLTRTTISCVIYSVRNRVQQISILHVVCPHQQHHVS